jgi:hypothetical protein
VLLKLDPAMVTVAPIDPDKGANEVIRGCAMILPEKKASKNQTIAPLQYE